MVATCERRWNWIGQRWSEETEKVVSTYRWKSSQGVRKCIHWTRQCPVARRKMSRIRWLDQHSAIIHAETRINTRTISYCFFVTPREKPTWEWSHQTCSLFVWHSVFSRTSRPLTWWSKEARRYYSLSVKKTASCLIWNFTSVNRLAMSNVARGTFPGPTIADKAEEANRMKYESLTRNYLFSLLQSNASADSEPA